MTGAGEGSKEKGSSGCPGDKWDWFLSRLAVCNRGKGKEGKKVPANNMWQKKGAWPRESSAGEEKGGGRGRWGVLPRRCLTKGKRGRGAQIGKEKRKENAPDFLVNKKRGERRRGDLGTREVSVDAQKKARGKAKS